MKFRGTMKDMGTIRQFSQLIQVLSKCCKQLTVRITSDRFILMLSAAGNKGISAWCVVPKSPTFHEFGMEGLSPEDNEIYMSISCDSMAATLGGLKSAQNVVALKIKLTKKGVPCLTFEIETQTTNSNTVCVHDIPVTMITRRHWSEFQDPDFPIFDISLSMPELRIVRQTLERLKCLGPKLSITASKNGVLNLSAETNAVRSSVTYSDLRVYNLDENVTSSPNSSTGDSAKFDIDVDMRSILQLVPTENVKPTNFVFSLLEGRLAHVFYMFGDISLEYCIPGMI